MASQSDSLQDRVFKRYGIVSDAVETPTAEKDDLQDRVFNRYGITNETFGTIPQPPKEKPILQPPASPIDKGFNVIKEFGKKALSELNAPETVETVSGPIPKPSPTLPEPQPEGYQFGQDPFKENKDFLSNVAIEDALQKRAEKKVKEKPTYKSLAEEREAQPTKWEEMKWKAPSIVGKSMQAAEDAVDYQSNLNKKVGQGILESGAEGAKLIKGLAQKGAEAFPELTVEGMMNRGGGFQGALERAGKITPPKKEAVIETEKGGKEYVPHTLEGKMQDVVDRSKLDTRQFDLKHPYISALAEGVGKLPIELGKVKLAIDTMGGSAIAGMGLLGAVETASKPNTKLPDIISGAQEGALTGAMFEMAGPSRILQSLAMAAPEAYAKYQETGDMKALLKDPDVVAKGLTGWLLAKGGDPIIRNAILKKLAARESKPLKFESPKTIMPEFQYKMPDRIYTPTGKPQAFTSPLEPKFQGVEAGKELVPVGEQGLVPAKRAPVRKLIRPEQKAIELGEPVSTPIELGAGTKPPVVRPERQTYTYGMPEAKQTTPQPKAESVVKEPSPKVEPLEAEARAKEPSDLETKKIPLDLDGNDLVDMDNIPIETNKDGTITLYHRTTPENASNIRKTGNFISKENTNETFFSNKIEGQAEGYGDEVIAIKVKPSAVRINDVFHNGEIHVAISNKKLSKKLITSAIPPTETALPKKGLKEAIKPSEVVRRSLGAAGGVTELQGGLGAFKGVGEKIRGLIEKNIPERQPKTLKEEAALGALKLVSNLVEAKDDIKNAFVPASASPEAKQSANILRHNLSDKRLAMETAREALKGGRKYMAGKSLDENVNFIEKMDQPDSDLSLTKEQKIAKIFSTDPKQQAIAKTADDVLVDLRNKIRSLGTGALENYKENYAPRYYAEFFDNPRDAISKIFSKRPFSGSKGFLKKRTQASFKQSVTPKEQGGLGLTPLFDNAVDYYTAKAEEMTKYIAAQKTIKEYIYKGLIEFVSVFKKPTEGKDQKIDDSVGTVYGPPTVQIKEHIDQSVYDGLIKIANDLGIKHERQPKIGGKRLGYSVQGGNQIYTRFATELSVLAHEIGHQLDHKYDMWNNIAKTEGKEGIKIRKELRDIADLTGRGKYARKKAEKMAQIVEAYVHAPDKMWEVAPTVMAKFESFISQHPELQGLREVVPSLQLRENVRELPVGGMVILGHYYGTPDVVRILNNHLSAGLRQHGWYRTALAANNIINQFQLGASAFHLGFTSMDAIISRMALGFEQAFTPNMRMKGLKNIVESAIPIYNLKIPVENYLKGSTLYKDALSGNPRSIEMVNLIKALTAGGGSVRMDTTYQTRVIEKMMDSFKKGTLSGVLGGIVRTPFAAIETISRPILEHIVPRQKLGVFMDLARMEMAKKPNMNIDELRDVMGKAWDSVDNRMGQLVYDNLFWDKTVKDLAMLTVRSVGWNLGTWREVGGGMLDMAKQGKKTLGFKKPELTHRIAYTVALPIVTALQGAMIQYLLTGQGPQGDTWEERTKDMMFPRTGNIDEYGNPERFSQPSYMKDIWALKHHPLKTIGHKMSPALAIAIDMMNNQDFYGTKIFNEDDSLMQNLLEGLKYGGKAMTPFSWRGFAREGELKGRGITRIAPFVGFSPAPKYVNMTPAEEKIAEIIESHRKEVSGRTKEQAEKSELKNKIRKELLQTGKSPTYWANKDKIPQDEASRLWNERKLMPFERRFKGIGLKEAIKVFDYMNDKEKKMIQDEFQTKWNNYYEKQMEGRTEMPEELKRLRSDMQKVIQYYKGIGNEKSQ